MSHAIKFVSWFTYLNVVEILCNTFSFGKNLKSIQCVYLYEKSHNTLTYYKWSILFFVISASSSSFLFILIHHLYWEIYKSQT